MPGETTYKTILPYVMCFLLVLAGFALLLGRLATLLQASQLNQAIRLAEQGDALRSLALSKDAIPSSEAYASEAAHLAHVTLHLPHVSVWELSDDGKILVCKAKVEQPKGISVFGHSIERNHAPWLFDVLDSKKSLVLNQVKDLSSEFESINLGRAGSILAMPTLVRDQVVGLVLGMGQWTRTWRPDEVNFFASISDMLALSLEAQARRRMELDLTQRSFFDHLTGLPNRVYIVQQLHNILSKRDAAVDYACVLIRVEGLVVVNDKFGFETGDQLMVGVAKRLAHFCGPNELVGRIGDNRFALFLDMQRGMNLTQRMDMLFGFFSSPVKAGNVALLAHLNAGACGLKHLDQLDEVMHNTEIALQSLHKSGRENTWLEYSLEHRKTALEVQVLSNELQQALEQDELFVLYQPITDLKTGRVCGAEALLRWRHPKRGLIGPLVFIPLAETTGSIYYIGLWVLRQAVRQIKEWQQLTSDLLTVSVNVSMLQLEYMNFAEDVKQILQEENINPSALELEVTEGIALSSAPEVEGNIAQLRAMQVALAIDDFGTGYASFSYLRRFEVGKIKIDRIFLDEVPDKKRNANLVKMIIAMGHTLNAKVTGEGIENIAQAEFLKEAGCDFGQGYHYAKPLEAGAFIRLLTSQAQPKS
jgi:diguanylate cyclase (GGDEF)-like protein